MINAYFDVLVRYGDQSEVLNFRDLIEVQANRDGTPDVRFRNLEYDLTRAIKRATSGFQSVDNLLASLPGAGQADPLRHRGHAARAAARTRPPPSRRWARSWRPSPTAS